MTPRNASTPWVVALLAALALSACDRSGEEVAAPPAPQASPSAAASEATEAPTPLDPESVELAIPPALIGQTETETDLAAATARVSPPSEGIDVVLQQREDDGWDRVSTAATDADGLAVFYLPPGPPGEPARFRALVRPDEGDPLMSEDVRFVHRAPLWADEFDGDELDEEKWEYRQVGLRNPEGNRTCAESDPSSVSVADGAVHFVTQEIPPDIAQGEGQPGECPHGEFRNGHIGTRGSFSFRYGVLAARIKFPHAQGQHGAFWSQPDDAGTGVEIDAVEYFGDGFPAKGELAGSNAIQHSIYWEDDGEQNKVGGLFDVSHLLPEGETWADDFHIYSVEWTPTEYIFRIDGHETFRTSEGLTDVKQYLILSLLTSDWELPRLDTSDVTPMSVDWVRVWRVPKKG